MKQSNIFIINWYHVFTQPFYFVRKRLYENVKLLAPRLGGEVIDFGCGSKPYKSLFINASSYLGVDIEISGHAHTNEQIDIYYDGKHLPFENNSVTSIFAAEVFEHIFNIEEIIPELHRVMKPGANLLITCPFVWPEHEKPYDFARYTSFGIRHLLEKNNFIIEEQVKTGNFIETIAQLIMFLLYCYIPKKPYILYLLLHQIFILPIIIITIVLNTILPKKIKRNDLYINNVILAVKK